MSDQETTAPSDGTTDYESLNEAERAAFDIVREMVQAAGLDVWPQLRSTHPPYLDIELVGEDATTTLGRNGPSLDALQYLANLVIRRRVSSDVRIVLDAGGYRERRAQTLTRLAKDLAAQVKERQEECELDPLPAHERRIIHNALLDDPDVTTYSEGEDPDRRIIIAPR